MWYLFTLELVYYHVKLTYLYKKTLSNSEICFTEIPKIRLTFPPTLAISYGLIYYLINTIHTQIKWPHCEFEDSLRNFLLTKYFGTSKWKNEVMVIKNTPNENDWPRAILELFQKKWVSIIKLLISEFLQKSKNELFYEGNSFFLK